MITLGAERELLGAMLGDGRTELVRCVRGLSDADARRRLVRSLTTPLGLLTRRGRRAVLVPTAAGKLAGVERDGYAYGDDASFTYDDDLTVAGAIEDFERACARSRTIATGFDLDRQVHHERIGTVSLRWIYRMIRELARHAGHADISASRSTGGR